MTKSKLLLLTGIVIIILGFYVSGSSTLVTLDSLIMYKDVLIDFVNQNFAVASLAYIFVYIIAIAISIPGATIVTITGGALFGIAGYFYILVGASCGAVINFVLGRYLFGESIQSKFGHRLTGFNKEIEKHGANYLLTLRLIPILPFFFVNLLASASKVKLKTFAWTTLVGIMPGSLVYWYVGTSFSGIDRAKNILTPNMLLALTILGVLSLLPIIIQKSQK